MSDHSEVRARETAQSESSLPLNRLPALILAGGFGTRLRAAYDSGPKSLAPVAGRPFLEYLLRWLRDWGIRDLIFCTGYREKLLRKWLAHRAEGSIRIRFSPEAAPLGTAGALKLAQNLIAAEHFLAINGDSLLRIDLAQMHRFHLDRRAMVTLALVPKPQAARFGSVRVDGRGRVLAFGEAAKTCDSEGLVNAGVYLMRREFLNRIPYGKVSLERDVFPKLAGSELYGFLTQGYFLDIGVPADFQRAQSEIPREFPL